VSASGISSLTRVGRQLLLVFDDPKRERKKKEKPSQGEKEKRGKNKATSGRRGSRILLPFDNPSLLFTYALIERTEEKRKEKKEICNDCL